MKLTPRQITRNIQLASILEPLPEKKGCTTRTVDCSPKAKLSYFLIAGVNVGEHFHALAERVYSNDCRQPKVIFDLAYAAQKASYNQRNGGKVNFGIIELLIPLVVAQLVYNVSGVEALEKTQEVLRATSPEDVRQHYLFRQEAKKRSTNQNGLEELAVASIYDYFVQADKTRRTDQLRHPDYIGGMRYAQEAYLTIIQDGYADILANSVIAYEKLLDRFPGYEGGVADYICIGLYLALCDMKNSDCIL